MVRWNALSVEGDYQVNPNLQACQLESCFD
jgi:hypothetical protein